MSRFVFFITLIVFSSCSEEKLTPTTLLKKSISYHDPNNLWNKFENTISLRSEFDTYPDQLNITLNNPRKTVIYENSTSHTKVKYTDSTCTVLSGDITCESLSWTKNFYHFILGLPMTLNTPEAVVGDEIAKDTIGGILSYRIKVGFEQEQWHFYFDTASYQLNGFAFNKNFEEKAERIITKGSKNIDGINFIKKRTWWVTTDSLHPEFAGTDEISNQ